MKPLNAAHEEVALPRQAARGRGVPVVAVRRAPPPVLAGEQA